MNRTEWRLRARALQKRFLDWDREADEVMAMLDEHLPTEPPCLRARYERAVRDADRINAALEAHLALNPYQEDDDDA